MPTYKDQLLPNESLSLNESLESPNSLYSLLYQDDGNLVLYRNKPGSASRQALWASNTSGQPAGVCIMQEDGNLVVYTPFGIPIWASATNGSSNINSRLIVQDDGNVVIYNQSGNPIWATNTVTIVPVDSSIYTANPRKVITTSDGGEVTIELQRYPSTGIFRKDARPSLPPENNSGWRTEVKRVYLTAESSTFMNASHTNAINIVPGAIYGFEDFIGGGSTEIFGNRNPITIYTDNQLKPEATGRVKINTPAASEILQGNGGSNLNAIRNSIVEFPGGIRFIQQSFTSNTEAELALKVTAGGSYSGFAASGGYSLKQDQNRLYLTVDVVKLMYTVKAERPQNGFFSAAESTPNKVYIKEVNYGSRVLANVEIVLENREDIINFKAAYEGVFKANVGMDFISKTRNKNERVSAYLVGAPQTATTFSKDNLENEIRALLANCTIQHAVPISYTLGDMDGTTVSTRSVTDEIIERSSIPDDLVYRLQSAFIEFQTGNDNKEWQSRVIVELYGRNGTTLMYVPSEQIDNTEFPVNQPIAFGLERHPQVNDNDLLFETIKRSGGLSLKIYYWANFVLDAWKINGVRLKLKFVDQNKVPMPRTSLPVDGAGFVTLNLSNADRILDGFDLRVLQFSINGDFQPVGSSVSRT
jgi:hypothetical protein